MTTELNKTIIKPPNRGFQIRKMLKTSAEQEKTLRDQLHAEIENKSKLCANPTYDCTIPRLNGYSFCIRHILQDARAPYKQCAYVYPSNGKKCLQAAPKPDAKRDTKFFNYCFEHSRQEQILKTRLTVGQYKEVETNEAYLNDLAHHIKIDKDTHDTAKSSLDADEEIDVVSPNINPFTEFENLKASKTSRRRFFDYASDSSSNDEVTILNNAWKEHDWDNSDNESVDSQNEDLLKHAGIYTTEEASIIAKQKLVQLKSLYSDQILRLQYLLREKRRKYLHEIRKERETLCSIHDQPKETAHERKLYEKLKASTHYHRRFGIEAVLRRKYLEKRAKAGDGLTHKGPLYQKCIYTEGGVKCGERALPCGKYCRKHILEDKKQVLFRSCSIEKSGIICQEPVANIFDDATCVLHINMPQKRTYTQKKYESETDDDEEDNIKKEDNKEDSEMHLVEDKNEEPQQIEMLPLDDVGNNVTIVHDQDVINEEIVQTQNTTNDGQEEIILQVTTTSEQLQENDESQVVR